MSLSLDDVRWIAHLARLEMSEDELRRMTHDLDGIVAYVDQLQRVNTEGVEPLVHPIAVQNVFRDDEPTASLIVDDALGNAPSRRDDFFGVPAVLEK